MVADQKSARIPHEEAAVASGVPRCVDDLEFSLAESEDLSILEA